MKLSTEDGTELVNPSKEDIARQVLLLNDTNNKFLILAKDQLTYMQVYGSVKSSWILEYQEGSTTEHFNVSGSSVTSSGVVSTLQQYLEGISDWRTSFHWKRDYDPSPSNSKKIPNHNAASKKSPYMSKIIFVFTAVGITLLGIGLYLQFENRKFIDVATPVKADVVELLDDRRRNIKPVYLFLDDKGHFQRYVYHVSYYPAPHEVGDIVKLHVDFSSPTFPDSGSVKNLETSVGIANFLIEFGVLFILITGLVWYVYRIGGELSIRDSGGISTLFARKKTAKETRTQMGLFFFGIFIFGVAGYLITESFLGFMIGVTFSFYGFALLKYLVEPKSVS